MMGGKIVWTALPLLIEMSGVKDVDIFIAQLVTVRDWFLEQER